jgi:hypothetical protein
MAQKNKIKHKTKKENVVVHTSDTINSNTGSLMLAGGMVGAVAGGGIGAVAGSVIGFLMESEMIQKKKKRENVI